MLTNYLSTNGHIGTEGDALKSKSGWNNFDVDFTAIGTDTYGWLGLPGGARSSDGHFESIGYGGGWWSSSQGIANGAWYRYLTYDDGGVSRNSSSKEYGFSVRCLRD